LSFGEEKEGRRMRAKRNKEREEKNIHQRAASFVPLLQHFHRRLRRKRKRKRKITDEQGARAKEKKKKETQLQLLFQRLHDFQI
jgi:hypothetical protein